MRAPRCPARADGGLHGLGGRGRKVGGDEAEGARLVAAKDDADGLLGLSLPILVDEDVARRELPRDLVVHAGDDGEPSARAVVIDRVHGGHAEPGDVHVGHAGQRSRMRHEAQGARCV